MSYLKCPCGSGEFIRWSKLRLSAVGGTVEEIGGWQCANPECLKKADTGEMIRELNLQQKVKELRDLTQEIQSAKPASSPKPTEETGKTAEAGATTETETAAIRALPS